MVNLGDYLGHLLSEVTKARMQADMETLRIAEFYASDPLLKHFPVPRMRLPNLELNVPVIISETPGDDDKSTSVIDSKTIVSETKRITEKELSEVLNLKLNRTDTATLNKALSNKAITIDNLLKTRATKETIAEEMADEIIKTSKKINSFKSRDINEKKVGILRANIKNKLHVALINLEKEPDRIKVIPQTSKIKEIGNIENVVTLKLSVVEDSVEWSVIDKGDDKTKKILVPE
jgi:hypothetical protein